jgi:hypothetical protein
MAAFDFLDFFGAVEANLHGCWLWMGCTCLMACRLKLFRSMQSWYAKGFSLMCWCMAQ